MYIRRQAGFYAKKSHKTSFITFCTILEHPIGLCECMWLHCTTRRMNTPCGEVQQILIFSDCTINFTFGIKNQIKGSDIMLEYDEYKVQLNGLAENIKELRDSL